MSEVTVYVDVEVSAVTPELLDMIAKQGWVPRFVGEPTNGQAAPTPEPKAEVEDAWTNVSEYECSNEFTAFTSSNGIAKHLGGRCDCKNEGETCRPVTKGHVPAAEFNTRPGVSLVKDEVNQVFTLA